MTEYHNTFDVMVAVAEELIPGEVLHSTLTADKVDSTLAGIYLDDELLENGTFIYFDEAAEKLSSDDTGNEFRRIATFDASTGTFTFHTALSTTTGKHYSVIPPSFPAASIINAINAALVEWGDILIEDTTSLDTAADTLEYTLPFTEGNLIAVYLPKSDDASNRGWYLNTNWEVYRSAQGSADVLAFGQQPTSGKDIKLVYSYPHPRIPLNEAATLPGIHKSVPLNWLITTVAHRLARATLWDDRNSEAKSRWVSILNKRKEDVDKKYVNKIPKRLRRRIHYTPRRVSTPVRR